MAAWGSAAREASLSLFLRSVGNRTLRQRKSSAGGSPVKIPGTKPTGERVGDHPLPLDPLAGDGGRETEKGEDMKVLVACEESQAVCIAFRELGHEAYSCDIQDCSGGHPEWHIKGDVLPLLNGSCTFRTADAHTHTQSGPWDLLIAHPPCTYLTSAGAVRLFGSDHRIKDKSREHKGWEARRFFMMCLSSNAKRIAVENPAPLRYWQLPPYTQIIEPYQFGDPWKKRTGLWLSGLPKLEPTDIVEPKGCWTIMHGGSSCRVKLICEGGARTAKERAKTFPGIARAMAAQWGGNDLDVDELRFAGGQYTMEGWR